MSVVVLVLALVAFIAPQLALLGWLGARRDGTSPLTREFWL